MRTLLLMRHGKSDWDAEWDTDHERPLAERGVRSAKLMGRMLTDLGLAPEHIISSTAVRARTTADLASAAGGWSAPIALEPGFYGGSPDEILALAGPAPAVDRLMLIGHEPTWSGLVRRLTGKWVAVKTASVAVVKVAAPDWSVLPAIEGELVDLYHPRRYFGSKWDTD